MRIRLKNRLLLISLLAYLLFSPAYSQMPDLKVHPPERVNFPSPDAGVESLAARKRAQLETVNQFKVFCQFHFSDEVERSGITFVQHIEEDSGKAYKAVHYDHGNGIAVADVDGDGYYDIYFVNQVGGNQLWKNLGHGKFENITATAGVGLEDKICVTASFADIDNDGLPDLFVTTVRMGNVLFKNLGRGKFKDITQQSGLGGRAPSAPHSSGAVFFDF